VSASTADRDSLEEHMSEAQSPQDPQNPELTSTIHLSALRSVPRPRPLEEIFELLSTQEREVISQLPRNSAMLIVIAGPNKGSRFLINDAQTILGRDPQSEIFLDDVTVSRKHAKIYRVPSGDYAIEDLGSLNGSYVNGTSVTDSRLTVGDEVQIGKFRLTYFTGKGNA